MGIGHVGTAGTNILEVLSPALAVAILAIATLSFIRIRSREAKIGSISKTTVASDRIGRVHTVAQ